MTGWERWAMLKSLWASVQGDPKFMRRVNGWLTIFWIVMIPVSLLTGWISSVTYVAVLSLWALVSGHWSAWQAARVEVAQQAEEAALEAHPIEERVVEKLVMETSIESAGTPASNRSDTLTPICHLETRNSSPAPGEPT